MLISPPPPTNERTAKPKRKIAMRLLFIKTAAVSLLMLGSAAAQVNGITSGIGPGSTFGSTGLPSVFGGIASRSPVGSSGIPMGATELGTSGLSPSTAGAGSMATAPVSPLATPGGTGNVPGLAGLAGSSGTSSGFTGFGVGGMQPLPGSGPSAGPFGSR
jgi:hypothetical protein